MKKIYTLLTLIFAVAFQMEVAAQTFVPQAGQFYTLRLGSAEGLLMSRAEAGVGEPADIMKTRLRTFNSAEGNFQHLKFVASDTEGQYYIVNKNGEYLYNDTWNMWWHAVMDPTLVGTSKGYLFAVIDAPDAPGLYRIRTHSYGTGNRVVGTDAISENSFTYADKRQDRAGTYNWAIAPVTVASLNKDLNEKGLLVQSYPNPFNGAAMVEVNGKFEYSIYDLNGKMVESGNGVNNISVGGKLNQGMYIVQVKQDNATRTIRVSKI